MTKLSGDAAEARLAKAWETILNQDPATQKIIHVLAQPTELPTWLTEFPPFEAWIQNDRKVDGTICRIFAEIAVPWPYVRNARRAIANGIPNIRIFVLKRADWSAAPSWLQYLTEVHLPAIATLTGETLYRVWREDCRNSGLPERSYDVNLYGSDGIMLAGQKDGDDEWRVFLDDDRNPDRSCGEREFIDSIYHFASAHGELIRLPPELQLCFKL